MTTTIAVAGKGGTGKTTLTGLLIRCLKEKDAGTILAIDADPASNLNTVLGMDAGTHRGRRARGYLRQGARRQAGARHRQAWTCWTTRSTSSLVEGEGVDLLAMGRPGGPGLLLRGQQHAAQHRGPDDQGL